MLKMFAAFVVLQLADLGTTIAALILGGSEANPLVQHFMTIGSLEGLVLAKVFCLAIGVFCLLARKHHALRIANLAMTGIVTWNAIAVARLVA